MQMEEGEKAPLLHIQSIIGRIKKEKLGAEKKILGMVEVFHSHGSNRKEKTEKKDERLTSGKEVQRAWVRD